MNDTLLRAAAVLAAAAILAAPYWRQVWEFALVAGRAVAARQSDLGRVAIAGAIVAFAWGVVPLPAMNYTVPKVEVATPSDAMQRVVAPVGQALKSATAADKATWAALWVKAAKVVAHNDPSDSEAKIANTAALRSILLVALDIGWRRIGDHRPGEYPGLREAVEGAMTKAIGDDQRDMDQQTTSAAEDLFNAIGWAGLHGG